jgi:glycerol-3-phosphate responsive antiterminator
MKDIDSLVKDNDCVYEVNTAKLHLGELLSPELNNIKRPVQIYKTGKTSATIHIDLDQVKIYAVAQTPV